MSNSHYISELAIIILAFNEENNLKDVIKKAKKYGIVIVVNDGSIDDSRIILETTQINCPLHIVNHSFNKGYGAALRSGFFHSSMEWIFFMDSDLQFDIQNLKSFWPYLQHYDAIIGYRNQRADNLVRRLNAKMWSLWTGLLFNISVTDINCAFKLFRSDTLKSLKLQSDSALINTEILAGLTKSNSDILEIPVPHFPRTFGTQSGASFPVVTNALRESIAFRFRN